MRPYGCSILQQAQQFTPATAMVNCLVGLAPLASASVTVKVWVVAEEPTGPLMTPVEELRPKPWGRFPVVIDHR